MQGIGACKFCGQTRVIKTEEGIELSYDALNDLATAECNCYEAEEERKVLKAIDKACENIKKVFVDENIIDVLTTAVYAVARLDVDEVTVKIEKGKKAQVKLGKTGKVQLKITKTEEDLME